MTPSDWSTCWVWSRKSLSCRTMPLRSTTVLKDGLGCAWMPPPGVLTSETSRPCSSALDSSLRRTSGDILYRYVSLYSVRSLWEIGTIFQNKDQTHATGCYVILISWCLAWAFRAKVIVRHRTLIWLFCMASSMVVKTVEQNVILYVSLLLKDARSVLVIHARHLSVCIRIREC